VEQSGSRVRSTRSLSVPARLVLLALVPLVGLSAVVVMAVVDRRAQMAATRTTAHEVASLRALADMHVALNDEWLISTALIRGTALGLDAGQISDAFGIDIVQVLEESRATSDTVVGALPEELRKSFDGELLARLRASVDSGSVEPGVLFSGFDGLMTSVGDKVDRTLLAVKQNADAGQVSALFTSLDDLHSAVNSYQFGAQQLMSLADVWFAGPAEREQAIIGFAERSANFERAITLLRLSTGPTRAALDATTMSESFREFDLVISGALSGAPSPLASGDLQQIVDSFGGGADRQNLLADIVTTSAVQVEGIAADQESAAMNDIRQMRRALAAGVVLTIIATLAIARSITQPLRRLVARAGAVRDGDVSHDVGVLRGPSDVRMVATTFEQLVDNLRLLEAKARALSRSELDNPVLGHVLPGALGTALSESVNVLGDSIAARVELQQQLWHEANHDSLTGIPNRAAAIEWLRRALDGSHESIAVLFVDLDDFKFANDLHGHAVGDEVLRAVATRMTHAVRPGDIAARLGGDEFMVIAHGITDIGDAVTLADRLLHETCGRIDVDGLQLAVRASVGVTLADAGEKPSDVLARADLAVYQAKTTQTRIQVFDDSLQERADRRYEIENALSDALQRDDELVLHYQPIVDTKDGSLHGVEALLRWRRPGHGMVPPNDFIPIAEASTLIIDIDRWVLHHATAQLATWNRTKPGHPLALSVNISGRHLLHDSLVTNIADAIEASGIDPTHLTIELTESVLLDDLARAARHLEAVRAIGVRVSIDDFGTGYTSISHLHELPIDGLKVDRSFISMLPNHREQTLVQTLVDLAHNLNLPVVAEGVETTEQRDVLESLGCESLQGFLISAARPADEIAQMLSERQASVAR
jgi:diguanylate cyclase (GGDEF)-like protein